MKISTIWIAKEKTNKSLSDFLKYLLEFYNKKIPITINGETEYEFGLRSLEKEDNLYVGLLYKYKRDTSIRTYIPNTRNDSEEKTHGHLILAKAYFCIADKLLMVEEKPPHFGHVMITKILDEMAKKVNSNNEFIFDFLNSESAIDQIFRQIENEKIKTIKFKLIERNPDPDDENLKKFEDLTIDTKSSDVEFSAPKKGLNHKSFYIEGGKILAKESKAEIRIETETEDKSPKTYDTSKARNKQRLKVTYKNDDDRLQKILDSFKNLLKSHK